MAGTPAPGFCFLRAARLLLVDDLEVVIVREWLLLGVMLVVHSLAQVFIQNTTTQRTRQQCQRLYVPP